ncbi:lantibiotic dehydratase [Bradyrhizobium sp. 200]|uniref:lantibiotic dehydratase n=1 Tax=Bradyrhizobium sp. 200 TaxID=2782665 RepID=UPI002000102A|nr:lantibiotic dehydratase [Bradyrhizobium sp. 200]UPJ53443.1 lantibiotic dehydratase [Bradyrhizobium sp. 200]
MVRAPLLPVNYYLALSDDETGTSGSTTPQSQLQRLRSEQRALTALAVGGGNLLDALERKDRSGEDDPQLDGKLLRFLIRMSTRPTPYGLFAGVALARWGMATDLSLASTPARIRTRPDMAWLLNLIMTLEGQKDVRRCLRYQVNGRAFVHAGRVFIPERAPTSDGDGWKAAVSVRATRAVRRVLSLAREPIAHTQLVTELVAMSDVTADRAEKLIDELWQHTLLLTELRPPLTDESPAAYVADRLRGISCAAGARERLDAALSAMARLDDLPMKQMADAYRRMTAEFRDGHGSTAPMAQTDMTIRLAGSQITRSVAREAARAAQLLLRLTPLPHGPPHLAAYRRAFEARYGLQREVPLLELLDPNFGLGSPSMQFGGHAAGAGPHTGRRNQCLYDLAVTALRERRLVVQLDAETLNRLETWSPGELAAPPSLDLSFFIAAASPGDLDRGHFQLAIGPNIGASAAGRTLGRFADLLGEPARVLLQQVSEAEVETRAHGRIWAELIYLPSRFRSANVAIRPHHRRYEIVLGTTSAAPSDRVIPVDQLVVGIREGRFYVHWPQMNADVVACAGHMLTNLPAPDICRFLDDVRRDGEPQLCPFDWGPVSDLPVLPRIESGRIVLSPAQWRINARTRDQLSTKSKAAFYLALKRWREDWQVPRYVYLAAGDNRLLLDLNNSTQAEQLRLEVHKLSESKRVMLQEALPSPEHAWTAGPDGQYLAEFVAPLVLQTDRRAQPNRPRPRMALSTSCSDRLRPLGSDWLFAKLYGPRAFEEDLLTGPIAEFCHDMLASGFAEDWFFIRYADPESHLRLRFRGQPEQLTAQVLPQLGTWASRLMDEGLCSRLCFDTYERELERYGGTGGMAAAEAAFGADSRAVVDLLRLNDRQLVEMDRTTLAVLSIDRFLEGLGFHAKQRTDWCRNRAKSRIDGGQDYRNRKNVLRQLLGDPDYVVAQRGGDALERLLSTRSVQLAPTRDRLSDLEQAGTLSQPINELLISYIHLHCNRLLASDRTQEDRVIELLGRARLSLDQAPLSLPVQTQQEQRDLIDRRSPEPRYFEMGD